MKKILIIVINGCAFAFLNACNDADNTRKSETPADSVSATKQLGIVDTTTKAVKDTVIKLQTDNDWENKIVGTWAFVGDDNAAFVIEKKKIYYPETFTSYKYSLEKDSIKIKYEDYTGVFLMKMKGSDTLILIGDEEQVYYRIKK